MNRTLCALVLLFSASCDAQNTSSATAAPAGSPANPAGTAAAKADKPMSGPDAPAGAAGGAEAPVKFAGLADCLGSCEAGDMIPTNRETCRLNCDNAYGAQPVAAGDGGADPVGQAATCMRRCYVADAPTDECANNCKTMASKAVPAPASDVLDRLGTCVRACHVDESVIPTNRATCELNCTQAARVAGPSQSATK